MHKHATSLHQNTRTTLNNQEFWRSSHMLETNHLRYIHLPNSTNDLYINLGKISVEYNGSGCVAKLLIMAPPCQHQMLLAHRKTSRRSPSTNVLKNLIRLSQWFNGVQMSNLCIRCPIQKTNYLRGETVLSACLIERPASSSSNMNKCHKSNNSLYVLMSSRVAQ